MTKVIHRAHYKLVAVHFDKEEVPSLSVITPANAVPAQVPPGAGTKVTRINSAPIDPAQPGGHSLPPAAEAEKASSHPDQLPALGPSLMRSGSVGTNKQQQQHIHGHGSHCHHGPRYSFMPGEILTGKVEVDVSQQAPPGSGSHLPHLPHITLPHINFHLPGHSNNQATTTTTSSDNNNNNNNNNSRRKGRSVSESGGDVITSKQNCHADGGSLTSSSSSSSGESNAAQNNLTITSMVSQSGRRLEPGWKEITLRLEGYGKTQWRVAGENGGRAHMREALCNMVQTIRIAPDLPPGRHAFPFEFELPDDLPPSFEGKHGFIRYRLRVKPGQGSNNLKLPFNVVFAERVDDDALLKPCEDSRQRNINFWCVSRGSRSVHAKVDRTVYHYQGDVAYINARFSNECRHSAKPSVKLVQQQTFYGRGLISKTFKKSVQAWLLTPSADMSPLQPDEDRLWINAECTLPIVTPSFHSSLIDVDYYIEIELADTRASLSSKAAAKVLMSHSATHNAVASIWILIADGTFQKKPSGDKRTAPIALISNQSKGSLISDTSSDLSVPITTPSSTTTTPLTINTSANKEAAAATNDGPPKTAPNIEGSPLQMKKMPYIREDSKEG